MSEVEDALAVAAKAYESIPLDADVQAAYESLQIAFGNDPDGSLQGLTQDEARNKDLVWMAESARRILIETGWNPEQFRAAIRCGDPIRELYAQNRLNRCATFLAFMATAVEETPGQVSNELAAMVIAEAFRKAHGDAEMAEAFWRHEDDVLGESALSATAAGRGGRAFTVLYRLAATNRQKPIKRRPVSDVVAAAYGG